jgi:nitroimidazol reductase NimA-like FMN-containing flavoprotein (pyridoxamine 5'-phosphate oxidase superfamily)
MSAKDARPVFRELDTRECHALLARHNVGRLAFSKHDRVDIVPVHYVHEGEWLYGRTAAGHKLEVVMQNRWVAFEVDEVEAIYDWRSVVVKGGFYFLRADGSADEVAKYEQGLEIIRRLLPTAFTPDDPLPERAVVFRIHIDELTGREARTR